MKINKITVFAGFLTLLNTFTALPMQQRNVACEWKDGLYTTREIKTPSIQCKNCGKIKDLDNAFFGNDETNEYIALIDSPLCNLCKDSSAKKYSKTFFTYRDSKEKTAPKIIKQGKTHLPGTYTIDFTQTKLDTIKIKATSASLFRENSLQTIMTLKNEKYFPILGKYSRGSSEDYGNTINLIQTQKRNHSSTDKYFTLFNPKAIVDNQKNFDDCCLAILKKVSEVPVEKTYITKDGTALYIYTPKENLLTVYSLLKLIPGLSMHKNKRFSKLKDVSFACK